MLFFFLTILFSFPAPWRLDSVSRLGFEKALHLRYILPTVLNLWNKESSLHYLVCKIFLRFPWFVQIIIIII